MSRPGSLAVAPPAVVLTADDLRAVGKSAVDPVASGPACACSALNCAGWDSLPAPLAAPDYVCLGTLHKPGDEEPTLTEWHPQGTSYWSAQAPLAVGWFPYNRCSVWQCKACRRGFVQYTEFGGYYVDHRVREICPERVV